jgi:hypothetical protein
MRPMMVGSDCAQYAFQSPQAGRHQLFQAAQSFADAGAGNARIAASRHNNHAGE